MILHSEDLHRIAREERDRRDGFRHHIHVCMAAGCLSGGSGELKAELEQEVARRGLQDRCQVKGVGCLGLCAAGPLVAVDDGATRYQGVGAADAAAIVEALGGSPVERLRCPGDMAFFRRQTRIVTENCGRIDPDRIEEYIAAEGYHGLHRAVTQMSRQEVIDAVGRSGLRGRGGAGFPTGLKWTTVAKAADAVKFVICNADEGDPGAFMDRSVLESDPHRVIEGMAIAGYAIGASQGFIYVRAEYPLAVKRVRHTLAQAERLGLLGNGIFHTPFNFQIKVRLGAGAFVCGEETALIASIEGRMGRPRPRPPFPAEFGLWEHPTLINNVETFANVAPVIRNGAEWFAAIGTEKSRGTKVFALAGKVVNTGLIEVPMGTTLRDIVFEIGGGIAGGKRFKAVQTGGPSGGCIPAQFLDMAVDYESLAQVGSIMGSGGMIVIDEGSCMVDVARFFMEFCMTESCGKCVPCRVGTRQIHDLLAGITAGRATPADLATLEDLCDLVRHTSLCGLGQSAPNPVLTTLKYFRDEYHAHIHERRCLAGACTAAGEDV